MRKQILFLSVLGALTSGILTACDLAPLDSTLPLPGTYVLESLDGGALPALVHENASARVYALADTLHLRADRTGSKVHVQRVFGPGYPPEGSISIFERRLSYHRQGGRIEITHECGPNEFCAPPPHWVGQRTPEGIRLGLTSAGWVYRRIGP